MDPLFRKVEGKAPTVDESAWVAPGAVLTGDVRLGPRASVWYTCVLRADAEPIEIGESSNVQDGSVIHTDEGFPAVLGTRVSIGHRVMLHGCRIEDDSLIGMGAVLLNGTVVGAGSLVAAGSVVLEGTQIPPGSLVAGVPGKVRRPLSETEKQTIVDNSDIYLGLTAAHAAAD